MKERFQKRDTWSYSKLKFRVVCIVFTAFTSSIYTDHTAFAGEKVTVTAVGISWDADSGGFAYIQGLSKKKGTAKAGRPGSRISVDGQPDRFALAGPDATFSITFETERPTFRLIAEGDRFPQTITQPYMVPKDGGNIDVGRVIAPRAEGPEHTWPLPIVAAELGYANSYDLLADNNAVIRILTLGSGEEGVPDLTNNSTVEAVKSGIKVYPFDMDTEISFLQMEGERIGAFIVVVPFASVEPTDKEIILSIKDTVSEPRWNPPRPWNFDPQQVWVRNGYATDMQRIFGLVPALINKITHLDFNYFWNAEPTDRGN